MDKEYRCNICESTIYTDDKNTELLNHLHSSHKEVYDLHKDNPEATVNFQIEFLQLNVLNDDCDMKTEAVTLEEVIESTTDEVVKTTQEEEVTDKNETQFVVVPRKKKTKKEYEFTRKRSWVWKYFDKLSNIIYRCNLCNVVLSIKGCNSNNMNRHVRTRHPSIYKTEVDRKRDVSDVDLPERSDANHKWLWKYFDKLSDFTYRCNMCGGVVATSGGNKNKLIKHIQMRHPGTVKIEMKYAELEKAVTDEEGSEMDAVVMYDENADKDLDDSLDTQTRQRRSWIWSYFKYVSSTLAQCRLCNRTISHGGNATGNMNRHLKTIHNKTTDENNWIWKVFDSNEENFYTCKICQYKCMKFEDAHKSVLCILHHLKTEHGVDSGDQIITATELVSAEN